MSMLILDADGVFMSERPYWQTALAVALDHHGLSAGDDERWSRLGRACIDDHRVYRITKSRGCNSNWDLAAVMALALDPQAAREAFAKAIERDCFALASSMLASLANALWRGPVDAAPPIAGFGIDRHGPFFEGIVGRFQAIFKERRDVGWTFARFEPVASPAELRSVLEDFRRLGLTLCVCTSRNRDETVEPMSDFGILEYFDCDRIITHDEVVEAQRRSGVKPLGKPHWFSLAAAACGLEPAVHAVVQGGAPPVAVENGRLIYVGDAAADFRSVAACRELGMAIDYIHVDSGVCDEALLESIRAGAATLSVVADLAEVRDLLKVIIQ